MTTYVDQPIWPWKGRMWFHLTADSIEELHAFARRLGLKREWFQDHPVFPHYDTIASRRPRALELGAQEESTRDAVVRMRSASHRTGGRG